jgi:hypothetical protein
MWKVLERFISIYDRAYNRGYQEKTCHIQIGLNLGNKKGELVFPTPLLRGLYYSN